MVEDKTLEDTAQMKHGISWRRVRKLNCMEYWKEYLYISYWTWLSIKVLIKKESNPMENFTCFNQQYL
jgi:hypothetical protein